MATDNTRAGGTCASGEKEQIKQKDVLVESEDDDSRKQPSAVATDKSGATTATDNSGAGGTCASGEKELINQKDVLVESEEEFIMQVVAERSREAVAWREQRTNATNANVAEAEEKMYIEIAREALEETERFLRGKSSSTTNRVQERVARSQMDTHHQRQVLDTQLEQNTPGNRPGADAQTDTPNQRQVLTPGNHQPGAYACCGRRVIPRNDPDSDDIFGDGATVIIGTAADNSGDEVVGQDSARHNAVNPSADANNGLVEATPLGDIEASSLSLAEASSVDPEQDRYRKELEQRKTRWLLGALAFFTLAVVGVSVATTLYRSRREKSVSHSTEAPTVVRSLSPSFAPSGSLDLLLDALPNDTLERMNIAESPQALAYDWLMNNLQAISEKEEWRLVQLFALATFYFAFEGPHWPHGLDDDWLDATRSECDWHSNPFGNFASQGNWEQENKNASEASCTDGGKFRALMLGSLALSNHKPTLPPEISLLSSLKIIQLPYNGIHGSFQDVLPSQLFQMTQLEELSMFLNDYMSGQIPEELYALSNLKRLHLSSSSLSGTISSRIGLLTRLASMDLGETYLSGKLPSEIGLLQKAELVGLSRNNISGVVPSEIGMMESLRGLYLFDTKMSGPIPTEIGQLLRTDTMYLGSNSFSRNIPSELGLMTSLTILSLDENKFSSSVPSELGMLTDLEWLGFSSNMLTGAPPSELFLATKLEPLLLSANMFTGTLPSEIGLLTRLVVLMMETNHFGGVLPTHLGKLSDLVTVDLGMNQFEGELPAELWSMANLRSLRLSFNNFSGTLPTSNLQSMVNMKDVYLNHNAFSGELPDELGYLASTYNLKYLAVVENQFFGTLPDELCSLEASGGWVEFDCSSTMCGCNCACFIPP